MGSAAKGAVKGAVTSAVKGAVTSAVKGAVTSAVTSAVKGAVKGAVTSAVTSAVKGAVKGAVTSAVTSAVKGAVKGAVTSAVTSAVKGAVKGAVTSAMKRMPRWQPLAGTVLAVAAIGASGREAEEFLQERWYQLEIIIFERGQADATVRRLTDPDVYPHGLIPLTNPAQNGQATVPFAPEVFVRDADQAYFSSLPPPIWLAGDCVARRWEPPHDWSDADGDLPHDPCLPLPLPPPPDPARAPGTDAAALATQQATAVDPPTIVDPPPEPPLARPSARKLATDALTDAFAAYEQTLFDTSYQWQPDVSGLRTELSRLQRRFDIVAAGAWHQPLPARDQPQPLLVQIGEPSGAKRFDVEGWFAVTVGRFVHFEVHLLVRLDDTTHALVSESRRLRSGEVHYLDHPVLGIIVRTMPVEIPQALRDQAERLAAAIR